MKSVLSRALSAFAVCALVTVSVFAAGERTKEVTFTRDINVNGTVVKKGTYKVVINDSANELRILSNNKEIAKAPISAEARQNKASRTELNYLENAGTRTLKGITFDGDKQTFNVGGASTAAAPQQ